MSSQLRQQLRKKRQSLPADLRHQYSNSIARFLERYPPFQRSRTLAIYAPLAEEVDTTAIQTLAQNHGKQLFLPIINTSRWRAGSLLFHAYTPGETRMRKNRFSIDEPEHRTGTCVRGTTLDMVCVPLVGFNEQCDRLGMGAGYYDRAFAVRGVKKTRLIGLGFNCQQAEFDAAAHDVPMDAIITETGIIARSGLRIGQA